jgi:hypothetical protein
MREQQKKYRVKALGVSGDRKHSQLLVIGVFAAVLAACEREGHICLPPHLRSELKGNSASAPSAESTTPTSVVGSQDNQTYHVVLDLSQGMSGFVRGANEGDSAFTALLRNLPRLLYEHGADVNVRYSSLPQSSAAGPAQERDEPFFQQKAVKPCGSGKKCGVYGGSGQLAPFLERLSNGGEHPIRRDETIILITDLQPDDRRAPGDGGHIGRALRDQVKAGQAVALIGVRARFIGEINDLPLGNLNWFKGYQPFFLVILGTPENVVPVYNTIRQKVTQISAAGEPSAPHLESELFIKMGANSIAKGKWNVEPPLKAERTVLVPELPMPPDTGGVEQFILPVTSFGNAAPERSTSGLLATFTFAAADIVVPTADLNLRGIRYRIDFETEESGVRMHIPSLDRESCGEWQQIEVPVEVHQEGGSAKVEFRLEGAEGIHALPTQQLYLVEQNVRLNVEQVVDSNVEREGQAPTWDERWTISDHYADELEAFNKGQRDVFGVANLGSVIRILASATGEGAVSPRQDTLRFIFLLETP